MGTYIGIIRILPDFGVGCNTADNNYYCPLIVSTELTMSLVKIANVSEGSGEVDVCVQFSGQFAESFEIFLNASASQGDSAGENLKCTSFFWLIHLCFHSPTWC